MRIAAIDSNEDDLRQLVMCLRQVYSNAEIKAFQDPLLGAQFGFNNKIDLLFTEILMARIDGVKVAKMMRVRNPAIRVCYVTRFWEYRSSVETMEHCKCYLKPISEEYLR